MFLGQFTLAGGGVVHLDMWSGCDGSEVMGYGSLMRVFLIVLIVFFVVFVVVQVLERMDVQILSKDVKVFFKMKVRSLFFVVQL